MSRKSIDEIIEWPVQEMKGCLIDNPDFTGKIHVKFYSGGVSRIETTIEKSNPKKKDKK